MNRLFLDVARNGDQRIARGEKFHSQATRLRLYVVSGKLDDAPERVPDSPRMRAFDRNLGKLLRNELSCFEIG
jgi:hypothetical protein